MVDITYIYHSGFMVETETAMFLFDYYKGALPDFKKDKDAFVFVSHKHYDHYKKEIFQLQKEGTAIRFVLSDDIKVSILDKPEQIVLLGAGEETVVSGCHIKTLRSTDEGVAFLVHHNDICIYHAGDLQWWHWKGESDAYNEMMKRKYQHEIGKLKNEHIDVAFLVLDPRLEEAYYYGFDYFMKHTTTKVAFPMHCWEDYSIIKNLLAEPVADVYCNKINMIEKQGQEFKVD